MSESGVESGVSSQGEFVASRVITEKDLGAVLAAEKADALASMRASLLSVERTDLLRWYLADMSKELPSVEGRSNAVSTDISDTIEGMLPDLMEIFAGGDEIVQFKPVGPEDVQAAEQETQYVNHEFMQKNPGWMVTYQFLKDGLMSKVGIVKVFWEDDVREEEETYLDLSEDQLAMILQDKDCEVVEKNEEDDPNYPGQKIYDVKVRMKRTYGCCRVVNVPPEEFGIARRARVINGAAQQQDASYCFHEVSRYESDLIAEGYDANQIKALPTYGKIEKTEEYTRDTVAEGSERAGDSGLNKAMRAIRITEHYLKMDYKTEGKTRLYRVLTGGEDAIVLRYADKRPAVEPVDFMPFAAWTPVPMPHRFFGRSIAELVQDVQKVKTVLLRGVLDNTYLSGNPRVIVSEAEAGPRTLDDLMVARPGGVVRVKQQGGVTVLEHPNMGDSIFPMLEYMDSIREWRTGLTRQGIGLEADALNNQSATAAQQLYTAAKARLRLIARIFAETGFKDLFWLMHATIRKNGQKPETVQLENNWVTIDPREWRTRNDLTVHVGIGSGDKNSQLQQLMVLATQQKEALAGGLTNLVTPQNLYNTAKKMCQLLGFPAANLYWTDPSTQPPPQQPPDPKLQIEMLKAQTDQQQMAQQGQLNNQKVQAEMARDQQKHNLALDLMVKEHAMKEREHVLKVEGMKHKMLGDVISASAKASSGEGEEGGNGANHARHLALVKAITDHVSGMSAQPKPPAAKRIRKLHDGSFVVEPVH